MTGRPEARDLNVRLDRHPETRGGSLNIPSIFDGGKERLKFRLGEELGMPRCTEQLALCLGSASCNFCFLLPFLVTNSK